MKTSIQLEDYTVSFDDTRSKRDDVWEKLLEYCTKNKVFKGDGVLQSTGYLSEEGIALSEIIDIINFTVEENE